MNASSSAGPMPETQPKDVLPLVPILTPAFGIAGAILILTGLVYCLIGIKHKLLHVFLSCAYLASLGVTVLILYLMSTPVSHGVQGAYFVAACGSGLTVAAFSLMFKSVTEGLGCLLGGFCIAMWLMTLRAGGLIHSSGGTAAFIVALSVACFALSFVPRAKYPTLIISSSFSGATATVLGVDCYSTAGLKEFWAYIWNLNDHLFPFDTNTYPLTKGIRAEIGCIPVLFAFGLLSQIKIYKIVQARKEKKAAEADQINQDRERLDSETGRHVQETTAKDLAIWEARYGDKKSPKVEQRQVDRDSFPRIAHKKSGSTETRTKGLPISANQDPTDDRSKIAEGTTPAPKLIGELEFERVTRRRSSSLQQDYPSLRPMSGPPRPILPESHFEEDEFSDGTGRISRVNSANLPSAENSSIPPLRVSSLDLVADLLDDDGNIESGQSGEVVHLAPRPRARSLDGCERYSPAGPLEDQDDIFDFERIPSGDEAERNSIQNSKIAQEDLDEVRQELRTLEKSSALRAQALSPGGASKRRGLEQFHKVLSKIAAMDRTEEWTKTLDQAEDPDLAAEQPSEDVRSTVTSSANDEHESLWSGFEGEYANTSMTSTEIPAHGQIKSKETEDPLARQPTSNPSRSAVTKKNRRKSGGVSVSKIAAPTMPAPVRSARVHQRNASLPTLNTAPTLVEQRQANVSHRKSSALRWSGNTDDMTLADRRASLNKTRTMSSGQVSTVSSTAPRTSSTLTAQSPETTTAMTTPMTSSPSHPHFIKTAHPLRVPYPYPPTSPGNTPSPRRVSIPSQSPKTTLLGQNEQQQGQDKQRLKKHQQKQTKHGEKTEKKMFETKQIQMEMENRMRLGEFHEHHRNALRKMQREISRKTEMASKSMNGGDKSN